MNVAGVLAHYDLGRFRGHRRIERGHVNEKWLVETSHGQYLLKRRHPSLRAPDLIRAQHALVRHLRRGGFATPAIVPTRRGTTFLKLQDEIYEVQDYIPGNSCDITVPAHFTAAARTLGRYHNAVQGFDHPALHRPKERYGPTALGQTIACLKQNWRGQTSPPLEALMGELEAHAQDLAARFEGFGSLPQLVIHSDYYADNLILWGDVVAGVVDYDLAHWCWRVLEVAEALIYFAAQRPGTFEHIVYPGVLDLDAVRRFLAAYGEVVNLSGAELDALPHMMRAIWLCASLHPPLKPLLSLHAAPQALPEILTLANWALRNLVFPQGAAGN